MTTDLAHTLRRGPRACTLNRSEPVCRGLQDAVRISHAGPLHTSSAQPCGRHRRRGRHLRASHAAGAHRLVREPRCGMSCRRRLGGRGTAGSRLTTHRARRPRLTLVHCRQAPPTTPGAARPLVAPPASRRSERRACGCSSRPTRSSSRHRSGNGSRKAARSHLIDLVGAFVMHQAYALTSNQIQTRCPTICRALSCPTGAQLPESTARRAAPLELRNPASSQEAEP